MILSLVSALSYFFFLKQDTYPFYYLGLVFFILIKFHSSRKDLHFVQNRLEHPKMQLLIEYQLFSLAFSIPSLFTPVWYFFFLIQGIALLLPFIRIRQGVSTLFPHLNKYIPPRQFEWISGLRKNWLGLLIALILSLILSPVKLFPLLALAFLNSSIMGFYTEGESRQLLTANGIAPNEILGSKILYSIKRVCFLNLPVLLINSFFHPDFLLINSLFLLYSALLMAFAVCCKYNAYKPETNLESISIQFALSFLAVIFPYLMILSLFLTIYYYQESIKNIRYYAHDSIE